MRYGPTNGPPPPTGAVPAGWIPSVLVSDNARARLTRPLPVCSCVPATSAVRAIRLKTTPFDNDGSTARIKAALPATIAAEAEVPLHVTKLLFGYVPAMPTPGAAKKTELPNVLVGARVSF